MATPSAAQLITVWNPAGRASAHRRLAALLAAADGGDERGDDTLGSRNRRLLMLYRTMIGTPLGGRVRCEHCATDNEFVVPVDAILAAPVPDPHARVRIRSGGRTLNFRLPRMTDIEAAGRNSSDSDIRRVVIERCRVGSAGDSVPDDVVERLGRKFEALDPAANIVVNLACSGCAQPLVASVDLASFIALELDRLVDGLFRDIDMIASAYGWEEPTILSLPVERRRRYVSMIAAAYRHARLPVSGSVG